MRCLAALIAVAVLGIREPAAAEAARPAVLDRPAIASTRAATSVLLTAALAGRRLVLAGEQGIVLLSDDNGIGWRQATAVPVSVTLTAVRFGSAEEGWAVGHMGVILHTTDGGETWRRQMDGIGAAELVLQHARDAADDEKRAAGVAAAQQLLSDGPDKPFLNLLTDGPRRVLVVGAFGLSFATEDAGTSWTPQSSRFANPGQLHLYGLARRGDQTYAVGEQGMFLRAPGRDALFERHPTPYPGTLFGVLAPADHVILAYGLRGTILRSDDDGDHWQAVPSGVSSSLTTGAVLADGRILLGSMSGRLVTSGDGGRSFAPRGAPVPQPIAGLVQAADGAIVVVGPRGVMRLPLPSLAEAR